MPKGSPRPNTGRPRKPAAEKILAGNPGKRPVTVLEFYKDKNVPKKFKESVPEYLDQVAKESDESIPKVTEIYSDLRDFVAAAGCLDQVSEMQMQDYAYLRRSYLECEHFNKVHGRIANGKRSPYVQMALDYQKSAMYIFNQIWSAIVQSSTVVYGSERNEFLNKMENRGF